MEISKLINLILTINSCLLIILIFNQNDNTKESVSNKNSNGNSSLTNPFEKITWISLSIELLFLIIKIKTNII